MALMLMRRSAYLMLDLRYYLWSGEEVTGDEVLPSNALQSQLMVHQNLDESKVI